MYMICMFFFSTLNKSVTIVIKIKHDKPHSNTYGLCQYFDYIYIHSVTHEQSETLSHEVGKILIFNNNSL